MMYSTSDEIYCYTIKKKHDHETCYSPPYFMKFAFCGFLFRLFFTIYKVISSRSYIQPKNIFFVLLYSPPLNSTLLYSTLLYPTPPHSAPLHSTPLHSTPPHSTPLHSTPLHASPRHSTALHSTLLYSSNEVYFLMYEYT